jgi:glucose-6-phosphate 1-dehydrogenase
METWKFILLGVTGDLAKLKILPALSQFADLNQEKVIIDLIGFSRSEPEKDKIEDILNQQTKDKKHKLNSISYIQGEYTNPQYFTQIMQEADPKDRVVVYMAVPPVVFPEFLSGACPYNKHNLDILIEKPFGNDLQEAKRILQTIHSCHLQDNVRFLDHYLFKNPARLTKAELQNFKEIQDLTIDTITIKALEDISVKNRVSYYDQIGALKDMFVHMYSLYTLSLDILGKADQDEYRKIQVKDVQTGRYESYLKDTNLESSSTNTYFRTVLKPQSDNLEIVLESGKKLAHKETSIEIAFSDGSKLSWNMYPHKKISFISSNGQVDLSLERSNKEDHTNLFEDLLANNYSSFVDISEVLSGWNLYQELEKMKNFRSGVTSIYKDNTYPPEFKSAKKSASL